MPAYHSNFVGEDADARKIGNFPLLSFRTNYKGPSYPTTQEYDIIDEVLDLFRPNSFFKNFEVKGGADRSLIYGILYTSQALNEINKTTSQASAIKALNNLALEDFSLPGDPSFPLNNVFTSPKDRVEYNLLKSYLNQFRQELSARLIAKLYQNDIHNPDKFWLALSKRKFMNKSL
ncbi:Arc18 protein [Saccharomycopsis crataegensis]|uniref:Actin-related protein 2/3 complex subunit 3 n=1 Tax=Saccharomycopsis crataegensis TaxID=43959 RepID=A0AAV5QPE1_9ASCO|nr:Arc18 protein [Saccharomycopsis crataegensis]